jgi:hypothetical protein
MPDPLDLTHLARVLEQLRRVSGQQAQLTHEEVAVLDPDSPRDDYMTVLRWFVTLVQGDGGYKKCGWTGSETPGMAIRKYLAEERKTLATQVQRATEKLSSFSKEAAILERLITEPVETVPREPPPTSSLRRL